MEASQKRPRRNILSFRNARRSLGIIDFTQRLENSCTRYAMRAFVIVRYYDLVTRDIRYIHVQTVSRQFHVSRTLNVRLHGYYPPDEETSATSFSQIFSEGAKNEFFVWSKASNPAGNCRDVLREVCVNGFLFLRPANALQPPSGEVRCPNFLNAARGLGLRIVPCCQVPASSVDVQQRGMRSV